MYAECVTGPRAVFNRKLKLMFVNKGGTFLLALSWKWGENIMRTVDHLSPTRLPYSANHSARLAML